MLIRIASEEYYEQIEAERYHRVPKAARVQAELTYSALALGGLSEGIIVDLGAGGGLSTVSLQALADNSFVLAMDRSSHMLTTAAASVGNISLPSLVCDRDIDLATGLERLASRGDRILADMSQPLPLRSHVVDSVLSVSAVQWLLEARQVEQAPQVKLRRLFASLREATRQGARLAMQFYPPKGDHDFGARALRDAAKEEQWAAEVVMDFPHHPATSKKWFLVAQRAQERPTSWCALCWPVVVGRCALQGPCTAPQRRRAQQQHAEVALRLARCGRRLRGSAEDIQQRLLQQLQPLQVEMAQRLDALLGEPEAESPAAKRQRTQSELRGVVEARLSELLEILHTAPSAKWFEPPPPLQNEL